MNIYGIELGKKRTGLRIGGRTAFILAAAAILCVTAVCMLSGTEETEAASGTDIRVYVQVADDDPLGTTVEGSVFKYRETTVDSASTVKNVYERAAQNLGLAITADGLGNITSIGGIVPDANKSWNLHQWMPLGYPDWTTVAASEKYDGWIVSGATYCLHISSSTVIGGQSMFAAPDFKPISEGYLYVRFVQQYDAVVGSFTMNDGVTVVTEGLVEDAFTPEIRQSGFWLKGRGYSLEQVMIDAMRSNGFEAETTSTIDGNGNVLMGWVTSMFGLKGDEKFGENCYVYWSQFTYVDDTWGYNNYTLGYYDPGAYNYIACVLVASIDGSLDTGGALPDVSGFDPASDVLSSTHAVTFRDGDLTAGTQSVWYGKTVDYGSVPSVSPPAGKIFAGWGDIGKPITSDTVYTAKYIDVSSGHLVRYFADDAKKALMSAEYVADGGDSAYAGTVSKASTLQHDYGFDGWSSPTADMHADTDLTPRFTETLRKYTVSFIDYDGYVHAVKEVEYGKPLIQAEMPSEPSRESTVDMNYAFRGWSISLAGYEAPDLGSVTSGKMVYAYYDTEVRKYTITVKFGTVRDDVEIDSEYGKPIGDKKYILPDGTLMKLYRNVSMTEGFFSGSAVYGDTVLYGRVVPGNHVYASDTCIVLSYDQESASRITVTDNAAVIGDVSQMKHGMALEIDRASLNLLAGKYGSGTVFRIMVPQGSVSMTAGQWSAAIGEGSNFRYSVEDTNTNLHSIRSFLKTQDYYGVYTPVLKVDGNKILDLPSDTALTLPLSLGKNVPAESARVWSLTDAGVPNILVCTHSGNEVSFVLGKSSLVNFVTGYRYGGNVPAVDAEKAYPYGIIEYRVIDGGSGDTVALKSIKYSSDGGVLFIPSSLDGYAVTKILEGAFSGVSGVAAVVIPPTVAEFDGSGLKENGVTDLYFMGDRPSVLSGTGGLTVRALKAGSWGGAVTGFSVLSQNLKDLEYRYYIMGDIAVFAGIVKGSSQFAIPSSVTYNGHEYAISVIGERAFEGTSISNVTIPSSITDIQTSAFENSSVLTVDFTPGSGLEHIWDRAFYGCEKLKNFTLPGSLVFVGAEAFRGCDTVTRVNLPDGCAVVKDGAFSDCIRLSSVTLGQNLSAIPVDCFANDVLLGEIEIPASVKTIGSGAFGRCSELTAVNTSSVTEVGSEAFMGCTSLESVTLGRELKTVGSKAFSGCPSLKTVFAYCAQPEGFSESVDSLDGIGLIVNNDVASGWSVGHETMNPTDSGDSEIPVTAYLALGLVAVFAAIGLVIFRFKRRI